MLNEGKSAAEIYKILNTVKRFKEFLPKEVPKSEFKVPTAIQKHEIKVTTLDKIRINDFGSLGKQQQQDEEENK